METFDAYFRAADLNRDGRISGQEAVAFFKGSNLPQQVLAQIWMYADPNRTGFLGREEFYNALRLVTVAQSGRQLTPDIVKSALFGPAASKIPAPRINVPTPVPPMNNVATPPLPPQMAGAPAQQTPGFREQPGIPNPSVISQIPPSGNNLVRQPHPPSSNSLPMQAASQRPPLGGNVGGLNHGTPATANLSTDWFGGKKNVNSVGATSQAPTRGVTPPVNHSSVGSSPLGLMQGGNNNTQPPPTMPTASKLNSGDLTLTSLQQAGNDSKALVPSGNGVSFNTTFGGDPFSAAPQAKQDTNGIPNSTAVTPIVVGSQYPSKLAQVDELQSTGLLPANSSQLQQSQSGPRQNQLNAVQSIPTPAVSTIPVGQIPSSHGQQQLPWPKITQSDIQKYTPVFVKVDRDRDGKISGEEARNLFLSWKLPREILKKVWDLSDQDKDGMLSFREFCTAVYFMERYRERRPLPDVLPDGIWSEGILLPSTGQFSSQGGSASQPAPGFSTRGMPGPRPVMPTTSMQRRPPTSPLSSEADDTIPAEQQKSKIPVLEKHLVEQLSKEEQAALNSKFQEAADAEKKVQELEKEILESREKIEFYRTKMQELIVYKSRCENRLNEISEMMSADKREVQSLAMKYEDKCKKVGDVASKLTMEEATFRDIQEKKLELYNAIYKLQKGGGTDEALQDRANKIQSDLEELVKTLNEQCKRYGLRTKPTTLMELPFGWQPGIQETSAVWDENWDKFGDDGFTIIKELTVEVEPVVAPPVQLNSSTVQDGKSSGKEEPSVASSEKEDNKSDKASTADQKPENNSTDDHKEAEQEKSPSASTRINATENHTDEHESAKSGVHDISPRASESVSDHEPPESSISEDKSPDKHTRDPTFDHGEDNKSVWDFNHKEGDNGTGANDFFFGLPPIRTGASPLAGNVYGKEQKPAFDSVPSTPMQKPFFDSVPSTPMQKSLFDASVPSTPMQRSLFDASVPSTPMQRSLFDASVPSTPMQRPFFDSFPSTPMQKSLFDSEPSMSDSPTGGSMWGKEQKSSFFDSVPSTPMYNSGFSSKYNEGGDDNSFDNHFSRFDSFSSHDNSSFAQHDNFSRFDSFNTTDGGGAGNSFARFDSFRSTADSDASNSFLNFDSSTNDHSRNETFSRFDSMRSTSEHSRGFSFDEDDPFGTGPFKSSESHSPTRHGTDKWSAF